MKSFLFTASLLGSLCLLTLPGCGPGAAPEGWGVDDHADMVIASTAPGGGALAVEYDFTQEVHLGAPQCIGGDGADCLGGIVLYGSESPGFDALFADEPEEGLYALTEGIEVRVVLTAASPEASLFLNGVSLASPGASVVLGESLEGLHTHGEFLLAFPGGSEPAGEFFLSFRLETDSPRYAGSAEFTLLLHVDDEHDE